MLFLNRICEFHFDSIKYQTTCICIRCFSAQVDTNMLQDLMITIDCTWFMICFCWTWKTSMNGIPNYPNLDLEIGLRFLLDVLWMFIFRLVITLHYDCMIIWFQSTKVKLISDKWDEIKWIAHLLHTSLNYTFSGHLVSLK